jgi:hypothetical protein
MVLKFRLISNEQDDFIRDFEIPGDQTFFHLHEAIQENLQFDPSQIASFFICNQQWEKVQEITLFELSDEEAAKVLVMDSTKVGDHMRCIHDKMVYIFDVFNERMFFIELVEILEQDASGHYPRCSFKKGEPPRQITIDPIFLSKIGEEDIPMTALPPDDELFDDEDLDRPGFDEQSLDDSFPDEE